MVRSKKKKRDVLLFRARTRYQQSILEEQQHAHDGQEAFEEELDLYSIALTRGDHFSHDMIKYWKRRHTLFSLFDGSSPTGELPLLDRVGWFSVTPEAIAARIAQRCRSTRVLDAFCGVGGNAIQFAMTCQHVIAIDIDPIKIQLARHNAWVYGVEKYITFLVGDWQDFVEDYATAHAAQKEAEANEDGGGPGSTRDPGESKWQGCEALDIDIVFLSPPWGGVDYRALRGPKQEDSPSQAAESELAGTLVSGASPNDAQAGKPPGFPSHNGGASEDGYYPLSALQPQSGQDLLRAANRITPDVCMFLPRTVDLAELATVSREVYGDGTVPPKQNEVKKHLIDIEEHWLMGRCNALTCFFGKLTEWKEDDATDLPAE